MLIIPRAVYVVLALYDCGPHHQVSECFEDFDHLRSGSLSKTRFRRCLNSLGLSLIEAHSITEAQFDALARYYANPMKPDEVLWTKFMWDVETGGSGQFSLLGKTKTICIKAFMNLVKQYSIAYA